jgi:hypothetical protein
VRLAAHLGDWPAAAAAAGSLGRPELVALTAARAEECRRLWEERLRGEADGSGLDGEVLHALAAAGTESLGQYVGRALPECNMQWAALEVIGDDPSWCPRVHELLCRPPEDRACGFPAEFALYLVRHDYRVREALERLLGWPQPPLDAVVVLTLGHAPDRLVPLLRRALRSRMPDDRLTAAAVLALFDTDWSRRELLARLAESADEEETYECRLALRESAAAGAREAVERWQAEHPDQDPKPWPSVRFLFYVVDGGGPQRLRDKMTGLSDLVQRARRAVAPG